jgi:hypothetical protein
LLTIYLVFSLALPSAPAGAFVPADAVEAAPTALIYDAADIDEAEALNTSVQVSNAADVVRSVSPPRSALELIGLSTGQAAAVRRVVGLFEQANLQLPPLVVRSGQDGDECGQHLGLHRQHESWSEIVLCKSGSSGLERSVIVHELAHAWAAFELSDTNKAAFQQVRGWEHWRDYENAAWRDNGTEQAAEVIAWGVYDLVASIAIDHGGCADLAESYRALTGLDPVQGLTTICEPPPAQVFS